MIAASSSPRMMWKPGEFLVATRHSPRTVAGYVCLGLGLHITERSPKGSRKPPVWSLTHLGSGHRLCTIIGNVGAAFPIATEIAECGDWDFDGLTGYRNRDSEILERVASIMGRHAACSVRPGESSEPAARAVAIARAG